MHDIKIDAFETFRDKMLAAFGDYCTTFSFSTDLNEEHPFAEATMLVGSAAFATSELEGILTEVMTKLNMTADMIEVDSQHQFIYADVGGDYSMLVITPFARDLVNVQVTICKE